MVIDQRENHLNNWLQSIFKQRSYQLIALPGDASFRRYYRCIIEQQQYIVMDAPPDKEDCKAFIAIANHLNKNQINTPLIYHQDLSNGFLLLSDFGDELYFKQLDEASAEGLYQQAIQTLIQLQRCHPIIANHQLKAFDAEFMLSELNRFDEWFIRGLLGLKLNSQQQAILQDTFKLLVHSAESQPQVLIHRDYHSRNLMVTTTHSPGVLDFQDAMLGPLSYDLVSLLRDCYIAWPTTKVHAWVDYYLKQAHLQGVIADTVTKSHFMPWFDLMGIQRHLKASFIFARKKLRDDNSAYLQDIPRTLNYVIEVSKDYPELQDFHQLCQHTFIPRMKL